MPQKRGLYNGKIHQRKCDGRNYQRTIQKPYHLLEGSGGKTEKIGKDSNWKRNSEKGRIEIKWKREKSLFFPFFIGIFWEWFFVVTMVILQPKENKGNKKTLKKDLTNNMKCVIIKE